MDLDDHDQADRLSDYTERALTLVALVQEYENTHPSGAPCFYDVLERMKAVFA